MVGCGLARARLRPLHAEEGGPCGVDVRRRYDRGADRTHRGSRAHEGNLLAAAQRAISGNSPEVRPK